MVTLTEAQQKHAESLVGLSADMDNEAMQQAKRLQRLGKRLQMSYFRAVRFEQPNFENFQGKFDRDKRAVRLAYLLAGKRS